MTKYIRSIQRLTAELYNIFLSPLLSIQFFFCSFLHSFIKTIDSLIIFQWNEEENNKKVYLFSKFAVIDVYITSSFYLIIDPGQRLRLPSELGFDTDSAYITK